MKKNLFMSSIFITIFLISCEDDNTSDQVEDEIATNEETEPEDSEPVAEDSETVAEDSDTVAEDSETVAEDSDTYAEDSDTYAEDSDTYAEDSDTKEIPADGIVALEVSTIGHISVTGSDSDHFTTQITRKCYGEDAENHIDDIEIEETLSDSKLSYNVTIPNEVNPPTNDNRSYSADFDISSPESVYLELYTSNGNVLVKDMANGAIVSMANGKLNTKVTQGELNLTVATGSIDISDHSGSVNAKTTNGAINCEITHLNEPEIVSLSTVNGNVVLIVPSDISADFDLETGFGGNIQIIGFQDIEYSTEENNGKIGTLGSGSARSKISISTLNGSITIMPI